MLLLIPNAKIDMVKNNFVFQSSCTWNELVPKIMSSCYPNSKGIMVPGSSKNSDLSMSISVIKKKLRDVLICTQKFCPTNTFNSRFQDGEWTPENFFKTHYPV